MPIPLAAITAASGAQSGAIGALTGLANNAVSMAYNEKQYKRERRDNIEFWNMQNDYNSPQNQMNRFRDAKLNPNLVYGQGNPGNATPIQKVDAQRMDTKQPDMSGAMGFDAASTVNQMYDLELKQATIDNLRSQNGVIKQEEVLKMAQTKSLLTGEERRRFDLEFEKVLYGTSLQARKEQLRQIQTSTDIAIDKDARDAVLNASHLREAVERMSHSKQQRAQSMAEVLRIQQHTKQILQDTELKEMEARLRSMHLTPDSPTWQKIIGNFLMNKFGDTPEFQSLQNKK